jgi:DNA gyrase subunit A
MKLRPNAEVMALVIDIDGDDLLVVTERGLGKRTPISEYPRKGRGGQGVQTFRINERTGPISIAANVLADEELILVSAEGIVMRTRADTISQQGRSTQGVQVMNVGEGDRVASLGRIDLGVGTGSDFDNVDSTDTDEDEADAPAE